MRRVVVIVFAGALVLGVAACSTDPNSIAAQANSGDQKGYVSGSGTLEQVPVKDRGEPLKLSGTTLTGADWSISDAKGRVLVLNTWGSWCAPCVAEAPDLQRAWAAVSKADKPVQFMGVNYRESAETAAAFVRSAKVTYPSLADDGGQTILALRGKASNTPTTLVLDRQGRIAARVSGPVTSSTLTGLIDDVLAQTA